MRSPNFPWRFLFREIFRGWKLHRGAVLSSFLALFLCSFLILGCIGSLRLAFILPETFKENLWVQIFLETPPEDILEQQKAIEAMAFSRETHFISPSQALRNFTEEFGEDLTGGIVENPLPSSWKIKISPRYTDPAELRALEKELQTWADVDTVFSGRIALEAAQKQRDSWLRVLIPTLVLLAIALLLIARVTVRLALFSNKQLVYIQHTLGSPYLLIFLPLAIEIGFLTLVGSGFSTLIWRSIWQKILPLMGFDQLGLYKQIFQLELLGLIGLVSLTVLITHITIKPFLQVSSR